KPGSPREHWYTHRLWDVRAGKAQGEAIHTDVAITAVAFSPDGKTLVMALGQPGQFLNEVQVREAATGKIRASLLKHGGRLVPPVTGLVFSPDGKKLLMVSSSSGRSLDQARLWDLATGKFLGEPLQFRSQYWSAAAFSPDGRTIVAAESPPPRVGTK